MKQTYIYYEGKFQSTPKELNVNNPFNNKLVATTFLAGVDELEAAINKAIDVEEEMANLPTYKKYDILMQIAFGLEDQKKIIANILCSESGKPLKYALGEIDRAVQVFKIAAEESKRMPSEYLTIDWTKAGHGKEGIVKYFPIGTIAGIAPFNFPLNLAAHKIAPAIAAGNPILLKPARSTPLSVLELAKIVDQTDLPKGAFSVVPTDREAGNMLVTDERIKMLSFTGSPEVGWKMKKNAGRKKIALELGGNAGLIVSESADIENAVNKSIIGGFAYSGQVCIHVQRIYVHASVFNDFTEKFVEGIYSLKFGDPSDADTDVSVMIDEGNAIRVENWVNDAVEEGAKVLCGGNRRSNYFEPTLITNTRHNMKVCSMEIFGPVVTVEKFENFENAISEINNSRYGLQAGVFTDSISEMNVAFRKLHVGGVIINDVPTFRVDQMPYGGVKDSGFGREGVKYAIHEMTEPKILIKNS